MQQVKEKKQKKIDGRTESRKIFSNSSRDRGGCCEIFVAVSEPRIILLFRGNKVLEEETVSLMPSRVSERCVPV